MPLKIHCFLFQVRNPASGMCFDTLGKRDDHPLGLYMCHGQGGNQVIYQPAIRREEMVPWTLFQDLDPHYEHTQQRNLGFIRFRRLFIQHHVLHVSVRNLLRTITKSSEIGLYLAATVATSSMARGKPPILITYSFRKISFLKRSHEKELKITKKLKRNLKPKYAKITKNRMIFLSGTVVHVIRNSYTGRLFQTKCKDLFPSYTHSIFFFSISL